MMYAYLFAALAFFGAGFGAAHQLDRAEILAMENRISNQKAEAAAILATEQDRVAKATIQALQANQQLDKAHEQSINTINAVRDRLDRVRIPAGRTCSNSSSAAGTNTGDAETEAGDAGFPVRLHEFLKPRTYAASKINAYAQECYSFVIEKNCGIETPAAD